MQKKLEQLLLKYPPEEVESRRWQKIADELGNRTAKQVMARAAAGCACSGFLGDSSAAMLAQWLPLLALVCGGFKSISISSPASSLASVQDIKQCI